MLNLKLKILLIAGLGLLLTACGQPASGLDHFSEEDQILYIIGQEQSYTGPESSEGIQAEDYSQRYPILLMEDLAFDGLLNKSKEEATLGKTEAYPDIGSVLLESVWEDLELGDVMLVAAGEADFLHHADLGQLQENGFDTRHFYGAYQLTLSQIENYRGLEQVYLVTPVPHPEGQEANQAGFVMQDYVSAIMDIGDYSNLPVIDLYHEGTITQENAGEYRDEAGNLSEEAQAVIAEDIKEGLAEYQ